MLVRNTLTEAMRLRPKPGAIGLILSLEGAAYYVFHSYQTRDQLASSNLRGKIELHDELRDRFRQQAGQQSERATPEQKQAEYLALIDFARARAAETPVSADGRHAEEVMIENWDASTADFISKRNRMPTKADVFLEYCPCQMTNNQPSLARTIHDMVYPASCNSKLQLFCSTGDRVGMKWSVFYDHPFQGAAALNYNTGNLRIMRKPDYINLP